MRNQRRMDRRWILGRLSTNASLNSSTGDLQNPTKGFDGAGNDACSGLLVADETEVVDGGVGADEGSTTTSDDAFFNVRTGRVEGVSDADFLFLQPRIRSCNEDGMHKRVRWRVTGRFEWGRRAAMEEIFPCSSSTAAQFGPTIAQAFGRLV